MGGLCGLQEGGLQVWLLCRLQVSRLDELLVRGPECSSRSLVRK